MDKQLTILAILLLSLAAHAQVLQGVVGSYGTSGLIPITIDNGGTACSGTGSTQTVACSAPLTVTAGDTIECSGGVSGGGDFATLYFNDVTNGIYDNVEGIVHPGGTTKWVAAAVFQNSAGGSITPQVNNYEAPAAMNFKCRAIKGTRTTLVLDGGSVNQTKSTTAANPTSGTAAAPTNANEIVIGAMVRPTTSATTDSAPWVPGGTITAIGTTYPVYDHYQIQTSAVTANSPMTASSAAYIDTQFAILNASNPAGYRGVTGFYGVPAIAKTNASNATAADLNGATTTLDTMKVAAAWTLTGTVGTYDTSINPTGTGKILAQGIGHTFGDAGTSIKVTGTSTQYTYNPLLASTGAPLWFSSFFRTAASGTSTGQVCDNFEINTNKTTEDQFFIQFQYDTTDLLRVKFESSEAGASAFLTGLSLDTDYRMQVHVAGSGERFHQIIMQSKSGGVWSNASTLNYDVLCATQAVIPCSTPPAAGSGTGSASSGSTSLAITSGTGTIVAGQIVIPQTGIDYLTAVESVTGTCSSSCTIVLSQKTSGAVSGTVSFTTKPVNLVAGTNGTGTLGSTAVTIVVPLSGTIAVLNNVGGPGIQDGTYVTAISGTSLTLSQPPKAAFTSGGIWFWAGQSGGVNFIDVNFGKWSSCTIGGAQWFSGMHLDSLGAWGAYLPN